MPRSSSPPLDIVVWIYNTFNNILEIRYGFTKYLTGVVGRVLVNISPANIFRPMFSPVRFKQKCQSVLGSCEHKWVNPFTSGAYTFGYISMTKQTLISGSKMLQPLSCRGSRIPNVKGMIRSRSPHLVYPLHLHNRSALTLLLLVAKLL